MDAQGIKEFYGIKYNEKDTDMWKAIQMPNKADKIYICMGVKASNYFMPEEVKSLKGPGGGGWIHFNRYMQVTGKSDLEGKVWGNGDFFAVGDCNYGCIGTPKKWILPPIPKNFIPRRRASYARMCQFDDQGSAHLPSVLNRSMLRSHKNEGYLVALGSWHVCHKSWST